MRARTAIGATLLAALTGCASCDHVPSDAVTDCNAQIVPGGAALDVLFIVDDSGSMAPYQAALAANLSTFIDQLLSSAIALDLNIGVTNTSVSEGGASSSADGATTYPTGPGAGPSAGDAFPQGSLVAILDPDQVVTPGLLAYDPVLYGSTTDGWGGHRILSTATTSPADLKRFFKANVRQGRFGSAKEQPLRAMRLAIDKAQQLGGANLGFLRAGARLAVVILTDEDDCSESVAPFLTSSEENSATDPGCHNATTKATRLDPLSDFVTLLDTTVGGAPVVAIVAGFDAATLDPTGCTTNGTPSFDDPTRLDAFLGLLASTHPNRTFKDSICNDFGPALLRIAEMVIPQTMPLEQSPADYRMMVVSLQKASGATVGCQMAPAGSAGAATADVVYTPAPSGGLPTLTFQNACRIALGDRVDLRILCAH